MIGSARFTSAFGSSSGIKDPEQFRVWAMKVVGRDHRFALVFLRPGTKSTPICPFELSNSTTARRKADQEERDRTGNENARHQCGLHHAFTDSTKVSTFLKKWFESGEDLPNVAIETGRSRMAVIDVDTPDEVSGWLRSWQDAIGTEPPGFTVATPGAMKNGQWVHENGGHLWVDLEELDHDALDTIFASGDGAYKDPAGWTMLYRNRIALVPPSVRIEGPYQYVGTSIPISEARFLIDRVATDIRSKQTRRAEQRQRRLSAADRDNSGFIDWAGSTSWDEELAPEGWVKTGKLDGCGCPIWTAPGSHASPKSATAHEEGCGAGYQNDEGHHPLHVWTDNPPQYLPPDTKTFTLFQHHGHRLYNGDMGLAARSNGISETAFMAPVLTPLSTAPQLGTLGVYEPVRQLNVVTDENAEEFVARDGRTPATQEEKEEFLLATRVADLRRTQKAKEILAAESAPKLRILNTAELFSEPEPDALIEGIYDQDSFSRVFGPSGHGKSYVLLDQMLHVALGLPWLGLKTVQKKVLYVYAEGSAVTVQRTRAWLTHHGMKPADLIGLIDFVPSGVSLTPAGVKELVSIVDTTGYGMVVFDTQHSMMEGDENSAGDLKVMRDALDGVRKTSGSPCVVLVHHTGHDGTRARGSSSGTAMLDTEVSVTQENDIIKVVVTKDKARMLGTARSMRLVSVDGEVGAVVQGLDALAGAIVPLRPVYDLPDSLNKLLTSNTTKEYVLAADVAAEMRELAAADRRNSGVTQAETIRATNERLKSRGAKPESKSTVRRAWALLFGNDWIIASPDYNTNETPGGRYVWNSPREAAERSQQSSTP